MKSAVAVLSSTTKKLMQPARAAQWSSRHPVCSRLTAVENVSLGVESVYPHVRQSERNNIVEYYLTLVGLGDALHIKAADLSNGARQRMGISRAVTLSPKLLQLDEPFGMLDSLTRWKL